MPFTHEQLIAKVLELAPDAAGYWVAYSGGLDSHALLHALSRLRDQLPAAVGALHVNHNLQPAAQDWETHCRAVCADLGVEYRSCSVNAQHSEGESPEAAARAARYQALAELLPAQHVLLTAHHQDDQAETLLLQLLRGAGPKGLAAMPARMPLGQGKLLRPLLAVARRELLTYAEQQGLRWIEDPSNTLQGFDRNYLRHTVIPQLLGRWPAAAAVLARSAAHQAEAAQLLDELAGMDLRAQTPVSPNAAEKSGSVPVTLSIRQLLTLSTPRRANLLRHWLQENAAPVPSTAILARIEQDVLHAMPDAAPRVAWGSVCLQRYRDQLFLSMHPEPPGTLADLEWTADRPLQVAGGVLTPVPEMGQGVATRHLAGRQLRVSFRHGGERLQPVGRHEHHTLKHLFQAAGVPPWERARVPLLYHNERLIAVAGYWVCEGFQPAQQEPGVCFKWSRAIVPDGSIW